MKRTEFLSTLSIGLAAACAGCLAACGKGGEAGPSGNGGTIPPPVPPSGINFNINLDTEIRSVGESKTNSGVIVVRIAAGNAVSSFTAVQVACTHEGFTIGYNSTQGNFVCPNHGSVFSPMGVVINGPATANLKKYNIAVADNILTVTG